MGKLRAEDFKADTRSGFYTSSAPPRDASIPGAATRFVTTLPVRSQRILSTDQWAVEKEVASPSVHQEGF